MVKIIGKEYTLCASTPDDLHDDTVGRINHRWQRITVSEEMLPDGIAETILHEVLHAINYSVSIGLNESQINALSNGIYSVMKDNGININKLLECIDV